MARTIRTFQCHYFLIAIFAAINNFCHQIFQSLLIEIVVLKTGNRASFQDNKNERLDLSFTKIHLITASLDTADNYVKLQTMK